MGACGFGRARKRTKKSRRDSTEFLRKTVRVRAPGPISRFLEPFPLAERTLRCPLPMSGYELLGPVRSLLCVRVSPVTLDGRFGSEFRGMHSDTLGASSASPNKALEPTSFAVTLRALSCLPK